MSESQEWAVVVPAHNSSRNIENTVQELSQFFRQKNFRGQVVVVENGSTDETWAVLSSIKNDNWPFELVLTRSDKGLGNAIREGLCNVNTDKVLITADDLPFGFSDIEAYLSNGTEPQIAIGSKAHADTLGTRSIGREVMSTVFRLLRRVIVGVNLGDTQGTIIGSTSVLALHAEATRQPGYLMTTELLARAQKSGTKIVELPVVYRDHLRKSNIRIIEDSYKMLTGLFEVRRSLRLK